MGIMTGAGSLSRVLGPVFVGSIYTRLGTNWTFGVTSVMMALSMLWLFVYRGELLPPTVSDNGSGLPPVSTEMKILDSGGGIAAASDEQQKEKLLKSELEVRTNNGRS